MKINVRTHTHLGDAFVCFGMAGCLERGIPHQTLVTQHADAPQVHLLVVRMAFDHLGRKVIQSAAHGAPPTQKTSNRVPGAAAGE